MIGWYKKVVFENYANFSGRARRSEYWFYGLTNMIMLSFAIIIDNVAGLIIDPFPYGIVSFAYFLLVFIPSLAVSVRRLHDVGKSGWFLFISLIPIIGAIWLLVLYFTDSVHGTNEYGPNPKNE